MKRVLIISYYWPPAGGPGVQRWLQFVRYLPEFGIEPIVYIPENPNYPITDKTLLKQVPDVEILKLRISEPYKFAKRFSNKDTKQISSGLIPKENKQSFIQKLLLFIRGNFFIPDARKAWVKPSVSFLIDYLENNRVEAVITTGPPHSLHLIGKQLQDKTNLPWITDFRDPWTTIGYHDKLKLLPFAKRKHKRLERLVLNNANHIITTSFTTKTDFSELTEKPISVVTNGFNEADFDLEGAVEMDSKFTLAHIGSLLSDRNPELLWQALQELVEENLEFSDAFQLKLAGTVSESVLKSIADFGLSKYVNQLGYLDHQTAFRQMQSSQVLMVIEIDNSNNSGIIAGKVFEYLLAKRPILAIGPKKWDVERIISETNSGKVFNYLEKDAIKKQLLAYFELYQSGLLNSLSKNVDQYSRKNLTEQLSKVINKTVN